MRLLTLKTILAATDLDEGSRAALTTARELGDAAGAGVHVVHVSDDQRTGEAVARLVDEVGFSPTSASVHVVRGEPEHAINLLSDQIGADAILLGPHRQRRRAEGGPLLGRTALALVTNASVPCMVVTRALRVPLRRTLAAIDVSDTARGTLAVALSWTSALRVQQAGQSTVLTVLNVNRSHAPSSVPRARNDALEEMLERVRRDAGTWAGAKIETATTDNADVASGIADYASAGGADLVVLGTRGLGLESVGRLGSVSAAVMDKLDTPVLLVPPAVWMTIAEQSS